LSLMTEDPTIINLSAKPTKSQANFNRRIRKERGNRCEICGATTDQKPIEAHHILDRRAFPQFAKNPENIIVACQPCHSGLTDCIGDLEGQYLIPYGSLPLSIRKRVAIFIEQNAPNLTTLIQTLRRGRGYAKAVFWWRMEHKSLYPPETVIREYEKEDAAYEKWLASQGSNGQRAKLLPHI